MATRNKTPLFMKLRDAVRRSQPSYSQSHNQFADGEITGTSKGGYIRIEMAEKDTNDPSLPPMWVDISDRIKDEMQKIKSKMAELSKFQAKALLPNFDNAGNPNEENIEQLTREITVSLKRCERDLFRMSDKGKLGGKEMDTVAKNIQRSMATDLQSLSMEFRKLSKSYLKRLEEQKEPAAPAKPQRSAFSEQSGAQSEDFGFSETQRFKVRQMESVSLEREKEVNEILASVQDLAQMMKDLSVLVIDQGTVVDRIDYNIQTVSVSVDKGLKQLMKAEKTQKRSLLVSCIMLLVVVCVGLLFVLLLKDTVF